MKNVIFGCLVLCIAVVSANTCSGTEEITTYSIQEVCTRWFYFWTRCQYQTFAKKETVDTQICCPNSFGPVKQGCPGECEKKSLGSSELCPVNNGGMCRDYMCDRSGLKNKPSTVTTISEDDDSERRLWTVQGKVFLHHKCKCTLEEGADPFTTRTSLSQCNCSSNIDVNQCSLTVLEGDQNTLEVRDENGVISIYRSSCSQPGCSDCTGVVGCLDYKMKGGVIRAKVTCTVAGFEQYTVSDVLRIKVKKNKDVKLTQLDDPRTVYGTDGVGHKVIRFRASDPDGTSPQLTITQTQSEFTDSNLFSVDASSNAVKVSADLSNEHSASYSVKVCASDRRSIDCFETVIDVVIDECSRNPCKNGATCDNDESTFYTCTCQQGWKGTNCDDIDELEDDGNGESTGNGGSTGNGNGGSTGDSNGGSTGDSNGGSTGDGNGGSTGDSNGGSTGDSNGGSTGDSNGGSTGNGNGGSTGDGNGGSTGDSNGGSTGNGNGGSTGDGNGGSTGDSNGGSTGDSNGGSTGDGNGGSTGDSNGGSTGDSNGGSTGDSNGGSTGNGNGGSTGDGNGGSTGDSNGGSTGNGNGGSTGDSNGGSTGNGNGGSTGDSNGGSTGDGNGGSTGDSNGGSTGDGNGGSTGDSNGGSTGDGNGGSTGDGNGGSTGDSNGGSTGDGNGGSTGDSNGGSTGDSNGGSTGDSNGGSTGNGNGGSTGDSNGGSTGDTGTNVNPGGGSTNTGTFTIETMTAEIQNLQTLVNSMQSQIITLTLAVAALGNVGSPGQPDLPSMNLTCVAIPALSHVPGLNEHCDTICSHNEPFCPRTHCVCEEDEAQRPVCTPTETWENTPGMTNWCDINCNTPPYECPPSHCLCDDGYTEA